jgi:hypothetical protein
MYVDDRGAVAIIHAYAMWMKVTSTTFSNIIAGYNNGALTTAYGGAFYIFSLA